MNTADPAEIKKFSKDSPHWWDENGPFAPLHKLNPVRLGYIREQICAHYDLDRKSLKPFRKLDILDIGCGGGLVCEPMARLGAQVTGIDADEQAINTAQEHAKQSSLDITYQAVTSDDLQTENKAFDVVLALEIIEHVGNPENFVESVMALCKPGGIVIFSTLNRTAKSFALGIVAAEYILRWVPRGTHRWKTFIKPAELARSIRGHDGQVLDVTGLAFDPVKGNFRLHKHDTDVNYFLSAGRSR